MSRTCAQSWARSPIAWQSRCFILSTDANRRLLMNSEQARFRLLPAVDELLHSAAGQELSVRYTRPPVLQAIRECLDEARASIRAGQPCPSTETLLANISARLARA